MMGVKAVSNSLPPVSAATKDEQSFPDCTSEVLHYAPNALFLREILMPSPASVPLERAERDARAGIDTAVTSYL